MARLSVYDDTDPSRPELTTTDRIVIEGHLVMAGILFERWGAECPLDDTSDDVAVLAAHAGAVDALKAARGFLAADVVRIQPKTPGIEQRRAQFLVEHTHEEDEARFFVEGSGAFYLHIGDRVFRIVCEAGDLLSVPAGIKHWFDMGPAPHFTAIRFFTRPDGWVASHTGDVIANHFPKYAGPAS